ncbi:DUF1669 domain-containing protein [Patescibacteria group bacterium]|nr:DUF1669 domain-containing protein [Patescibacteria group bacterium]
MIKNIIWEIKKHKSKFYIILSLILLIGGVLVYFSFKTDLNLFKVSKSKFYLPKKEIVKNKDFQGEVFFNDSMHTSKLSDLITRSIDNSDSSIDMSIYSINNRIIVDFLNMAGKKGLDINLILDKSSKEKHERVFKDISGLNINYLGDPLNKTGDYMHNKFTIFDKDTNQEKLLFGSFNYTGLQEKYDPSFVLETKNQAIIQAFKEEYNLLSEGLRGYKKIRINEYKPFNSKIFYNNGWVEVWFSPGFRKNSLKQRLIELIESADKSIDIIIWRFTDEDVAIAILKKAKQGVKVKIITDDYYIWSNNSMLDRLVNWSDKKTKKNIEIVSDLYRTLDLNNQIKTNKDYFNPYIHQHTLIVDKKVTLSGTNNWTYNGFFKNDESIIISNADFWVNAFQNSFHKHYNDLRNQKLDLNVEENNLITIFGKKDFIGNKLSVYNEESEKNEVPKLCFTTIFDQVNFSFKIPDSCFQKHSIIYIIDNNNKVLGSNYLNLK